jgi:hypothetical protein
MLKRLIYNTYIRQRNRAVKVIYTKNAYFSAYCKLSIAAVVRNTIQKTWASGSSKGGKKLRLRFTRSRTAGC